MIKTKLLRLTPIHFLSKPTKELIYFKLGGLKTPIPRWFLILFSLHKYLKDFESSLLVRGPPSYKVSWRFFFSCKSYRVVVPRYSDANLVGKYLRYLGLLKLFSTPLTTIDLFKKPENHPRRVCLESRVQSTIRKTVTAVHFTTIPCEPYTAHKVQGS